MKKFLLFLIIAIVALYVLALCFPGRPPDAAFEKEDIEPNLTASIIVWGIMIWGGCDYGISVSSKFSH